MRCFLPFAALLSMFAPLSIAATPPVLAQFSADLKGLDGRFEQRVYDANGRLDEETRGRVALSAPRQFRWEYDAPFPQLIVADGTHVWVYDPDLEQVQVRIQSHEEQHSPLTALIDPDELERQFVVAAAGAEQGMEWVLLTPKDSDSAQIASARIGFAQGQLGRMVLADALGQRTEIDFSGWKRNPAFAADTFAFTPPDGVDVIGDMAQSAEVYGLPD